MISPCSHFATMDEIKTNKEVHNFFFFELKEVHNLAASVVYDGQGRNV
jgi:hypothetical protein